MDSYEIILKCLRYIVKQHMSIYGNQKFGVFINHTITEITYESVLNYLDKEIETIEIAKSGDTSHTREKR